MTTNLKKITSVILATFMFTSVSANAAEGIADKIDISEVITTVSENAYELPVQEEDTSEPIIHTETVIYKPDKEEILTTDISATNSYENESVTARSLTDSDWQTLYGEYFGETYFFPTDEIKKGHIISGKENRVRIQQTDLSLKGKNGLDLNIIRVHDNQELDYVSVPESTFSNIANTRYVYTFNSSDGSVKKIAFHSNDEFYTHAINGLRISEFSDELYNENKDIYYYRFEEINEYVTEDISNSIYLTYDNSVTDFIITETGTGYNLKQYRLLPNKNILFDDWEFVFPEAYIFRTRHENESSFKKKCFNRNL